ncbi:unnamed protein product [Diamesa serratosioi]
MAAVIRMKRHINEEPLDAFVLNCKKRKTNGTKDQNQSETTSVLKFVGTVNQDTNITEHIAKLTKDEAKDIITRKQLNPAEKLRSRVEQNKEKSQNNRFKIVNYTRTLDTEETENNQKLTIVDVEKERNVSNVASTSTAIAPSANVTEEPYVYDLYIAEANETILQYPESIDLNDLSILEYNDYLYSRPRLMNDSESDDNVEDEDSNDENNWRNDYPDEDDDNISVGERQMRNAIANFDLDNDLSSEEESDLSRNGFVNSVDSQAIGFEDDLDYSNSNRNFESYARYRKRIEKEMNEEGNDDSDDESENSDNNSYYSD